MELAGKLRAEARRTDERRLLVLAGAADRTRDQAEAALAAADVDPGETTLVGPEPFLDCESHDTSGADALLGRTRTAVVYDAHGATRPNALGQAVGAVDGGGLFVLLAPPLSAWPDRRDAFDESLAVPPFGLDAVAGHFRSRLVATIRAHPGVAVVDVDAGVLQRDGLTHPAPRRPRPEPTPPADHDFPAAAYEACLTADQVDALAVLEGLQAGEAVVVEADRGRGKSSAAGLAAGSLALAGRDVLVTAPAYGRAREGFVRAESLLSSVGALDGTEGEPPRRLDTPEVCVRYEPPVAAAAAATDSVVLVDEAAALPVRLLKRFLDASAVAYITTIHGYEGAGRGFSVRFRDRLSAADRTVTEVTMTEPIRYAAGDPVEVWATRALLLDARPAVDPLLDDARPEIVTYAHLDPEDLLDDEHLLREAFGLLVLAHYRTEPDDLARVLDAPNVAVRALLHRGHVATVALLAREGGLSAERRAAMYAGGRIAGNMLPDVLTTQLRDERAVEPVGWRVMRIATHPAARRRGLGSKLLSAVESEAADDLDWLGVGYGATPELLSFWRANGYRTVHLSTTRNERSGEHSAIMLRPLSPAGEALENRHAAWFCQRLPGMLSDPLSDLDPDVVRATLRSVGATAPLDLSPFEWRLLAGSPFGAGLFDTAPGAFRSLALHYLTDRPAGVADDGDQAASGDGPALDATAERLLVRKVLQGRPWEETASTLGFHSTRACMRRLGETVESLVAAYGDENARAELKRFR